MSKGITKDKILSTAMKLGKKNGIRAVTMGAIATKLKIKTPSLYKHIKDLNEVLDELAIIGSKHLIDQLSNLKKKPMSENLIFEMATLYRELARENRVLYETLSESHVIRSKAYQNVAQEFLLLILEFLKAIPVADTNLIHVARSLRSLTHGFIMLELDSGFGLPEEINISFQYAIQTWFKGVKE